MSVQQKSYLDHFLGSLTKSLPPEALRGVVNFQFDEATRARAASLAEKANEGLLSDEERDEYAEYIEAVDLIAFIQASAQSLLAKHGS